MKKKYRVNRYLGVPVITDRNGRYIPRHLKQKPSCWRTGRHAKGHFKRLGQVFLTENGLRVAVLKFNPVKYKHRHRYTPLRRFTNSYINSKLLKQLTKKGS